MTIKHILKKIKSAKKILILPSQPADLDCLSSALAMYWFVKEYIGKDDVRIYSFFHIPPKLFLFDEFKEIEQTYLANIDIGVYDLIIGLDGNGYDRYLTNSYQKFVTQESVKEKFVIFDHHQPGKDSEFLATQSIVDATASSTTLVLYKNLFRDIKITPTVATYLYAGLVSDTGNFKWNINSETLKVASELLEKGADYLKSGNINIPQKEIEFTLWAIQHTQYFPELRTTLLYIDKGNYSQLDEKFGDKWDFKDLDRHYKNSFCKLIEGFDYYLILKEDKNADNVRITWRMRDFPVRPINFVEIMQEFGYEAGGHMNSASARAYGKKVEEVWQNIKNKFEKLLKT